MVLLIILGGVISLLAAMAINDAVVYQNFPVTVSNLIPMGFLVTALIILMALIAMT
jgi:hypothetical protein